jgi:hypothetical protein
MATQNKQSTLGLTQRLIAGIAAVIATIIWTHAIAGILRNFGPQTAPLAALPLTLAAIFVSSVGIATWGSRRSNALVAASGLSAVAILEVVSRGVWPASLALLPAAGLASELGRRLADRLPDELNILPRRHRLVAVLWAMLALGAVIQVGRLATFMTDPESDWFLTTRNPFWAKHECLPAYLYGAELSNRGVDNLYDSAHYPALNPEAETFTTIEGMTPEDPFQYPPQFLLLPRLAISTTLDYAALRLVWFGVQSTLFLFVAGWLTLWVGGRQGLLAALLLPAALAAFPTLHALQFGQVHLAAVTLGVAAMLAFDSQRRALGGGLLALATLSKIFPGLLLVVLAAQRRWRAFAWSAGFMLAITIVAWGILGPAPFIAFLDYQLPRLTNGDAFAFDQAWPELHEFIVADNQGVRGLVEKFREMGIPGLDGKASLWATKLYGIAVLIATVLVSRRMALRSRHLQAISWFAILGLGSLASAGAWGDYVPLVATWMMTFLVSRLRDNWLVAVSLSVCWLFQFALVGTSPLGSWFSPEFMIPLSALSGVMMLTLYGWALLQPSAAKEALRIQ